MNNNAMFRKWPLNNFNSARTVGTHNAGILSGVRPTPPSFGSTNNAVESRQEFRRLNPVKPEGKWVAVMSSSDVIASKKRAAIGKSAYYSPNNMFSTKRSNVNEVNHVIQKMRSSGSVAPAKKGALR